MKKLSYLCLVLLLTTCSKTKEDDKTTSIVGTYTETDGDQIIVTKLDNNTVSISLRPVYCSCHCIVIFDKVVMNSVNNFTLNTLEQSCSNGPYDKAEMTGSGSASSGGINIALHVKETKTGSTSVNEFSDALVGTK